MSSRQDRLDAGFEDRARPASFGRAQDLNLNDARPASRNASIATSLPTRRRKRTHSTTVRAGLVMRAGTPSKTALIHVDTD